VINWSYGDKKVRLSINVGVAYSSDIDIVIRLLKDKEKEIEISFPQRDIHIRSDLHKLLL
jgi:small-conductance mechanosensitive channel